MKVGVGIEMGAERYSEAVKVLEGEGLTVEGALYILLLECARSGRRPLPPEESYFSEETLEALAEAERALDDPDARRMTFEEMMRELNGDRGHGPSIRRHASCRVYVR